MEEEHKEEKRAAKKKKKKFDKLIHMRCSEIQNIPITIHHKNLSPTTCFLSPQMIKKEKGQALFFFLFFLVWAGPYIMGQPGLLQATGVTTAS